MDALTQLDAWLSELGPNHPDIEEIRADGAEPRWGIEYADGLQVAIEANAETGGLSLSALLGVPPAGEEMTTAELALRANGVQAVISGGCLGQVGLDGDYGLFQQLAAVPGGPVAFQDALEHFAEVARRWRTAIAMGASTEGAIESAAAFDAMRV